jgi:hypothetical protein
MEHLYLAAYLLPAAFVAAVCFVVCHCAHDDYIHNDMALAALDDEAATPPIPLETWGDYAALAGLSAVAGLMWPLAAPFGLYLIWREILS